MLILDAGTLPLILKEVNEDEMKDFIQQQYNYGWIFQKRFISLLKELTTIIIVDGNADVVKDFFVKGDSLYKSTFIWAKNSKALAKELNALTAIHFLIDYTYFPLDKNKIRVELIHINDFLLNETVLCDIRKFFIDDILKDL